MPTPALFLSFTSPSLACHLHSAADGGARRASTPAGGAYSSSQHGRRRGPRGRHVSGARTPQWHGSRRCRSVHGLALNASGQAVQCVLAGRRGHDIRCSMSTDMVCMRLPASQWIPDMCLPIPQLPHLGTCAEGSRQSRACASRESSVSGRSVRFRDSTAAFLARGSTAAGKQWALVFARGGPGAV